MKSQNEAEVQKLAEYTAKRILDSVLAGKHVIEYSEMLSGSEIYKDLKNGQTRDIIFNNLELFDGCLNTIVFKRIVYLIDEGFVVFDENANYRSRTEEEMEEFLTVD
jgi:hypothetical protein